MLMDSPGWRPNHEPPSSSGGRNKELTGKKEGNREKQRQGLFFTDLFKTLFWTFENKIGAVTVTFYKKVEWGSGVGHYPNTNDHNTN